MQRRLSLYEIKKPVSSVPEYETIWFCDTLGLSSGRDIDCLATQIITTLLYQYQDGEGLSTDQLAQLLDIAPARVNHHVRNLARSGIVYREKKLVHMRGLSLRESVRELRKDANRIFDELEEIAESIDDYIQYSK
ncbi:MAG: helix-turn-helix domain-containing protein [Methanomicrobiales archaeon]|jgi:predicted transcriptional regulator|nr:helix-turn-helix domain-containing protein [Methanomicrobiales archaeon]